MTFNKPVVELIEQEIVRRRFVVERGENSPECLRQTQLGLLLPRQRDKPCLTQQDLSSLSFTPLGRTHVLQDVSWTLLEQGPSPLHPCSLAVGGQHKGQVQGRDMVPKSAAEMLNF